MNNKERTYQAGPDKTRIQAVLTKAGRDQLGVGRDRENGITATDEGLTPVDIRRAGFRKLATRAIAVVAGSAVLAGTGAYVEHQVRSANQADAAQGHELYDHIQANVHNTQPIETQPTTAEVRAMGERIQP
ncbi:MAG TPA: hypothetical protein VMU97_02775 [Candidatus Dormibacteraeota bacterium]|nr:hypothetical protein [Candidatus Dormibacteraeota bacterium]